LRQFRAHGRGDELARIAAKFVHEPWVAFTSLLAAAAVQLGKTYPRPIIEHGAARARVLAALQGL
jgi:deoxyribodipyrimidine photo-lyase